MPKSIVVSFRCLESEIQRVYTELQAIGIEPRSKSHLGNMCLKLALAYLERAAGDEGVTDLVEDETVLFQSPEIVPATPRAEIDAATRLLTGGEE